MSLFQKAVQAVYDWIKRRRNMLNYYADIAREADAKKQRRRS
jgi:predicted DNA-binding protein YlxM (UPF0122 family)